MLRQNSTMKNNLSNILTSTKATTTSTTIMKNSSGSALEDLPKQFVSSMKTLFDILDDQHTGYVRFVDIQKGWQDDGSKGLPHGVLDALHKVTPTSGLLSFERFCTGLKLCLLRNQREHLMNKPQTTTSNKSALKSALSNRSPSVPLMHMQEHLTSYVSTPTTTAAAQNLPWNNIDSLQLHNINKNNNNNIVNTQRTLSLPQLSPDSDFEDELRLLTTKANNNTDACQKPKVYDSPPPPPKPPRASATTIANSSKGAGISGRTGIRHALQNWQMGILLHEMENKELGKHAEAGYRGSADGGSSSATDSGTIANDISIKKSSSKRREPRRHTLQSGIDYNLLKRRLKQFEEERDVLLLGLEAVEKAREWYAQQLSNVQDKIKYLGSMGSHVEQWSEVQQERLNFQRARVMEINRNLQTLTDSWEHNGFPMHFNLAIRPANSSAKSNSLTSERLRQQNHVLSNEVNFKSKRISLLEREKQILVHELYELQQRVSHIGGTTTTPGAYLSILGQTSPGCSSSSGALGDADVVF